MASSVGATSEFDWNDVKLRVSALEDFLVGLAVRRAIGGEDELVVRDLLPYIDFPGDTAGATDGFVNEVWRKDYTAAATWTANTDNKFIYQTLPINKTIGFYAAKRLQAAGPVSYLKFQLGPAKVKDIWQVEDIDNQPQHMILANAPVYYDRKEKCYIYAYPKTLAVENLKLLGRTCEPIGENIMAGAK